MWRHYSKLVERTINFKSYRICKLRKQLFSSSPSSYEHSAPNSKIKSKSEHLMALEKKYGAHNYKSIPVTLSRGQGVHVWDVEGNKYLDFLSAYSAVNQGHCHPRIVETLIKQASVLTLSSRAFYNDALGEYSEYITKYFGYPRVLPMNTGVEACESAVKIARRWGYEIKKIPDNEAMIVFAENNFWGRSIAAVSASTDPDSYSNYGPYTPNFEKIEYNNINALENFLSKNHKNTAAFMMEPIQGEAGVIIPDAGYLRDVRSICDKYNILWIADEVQTGLGRTGKELCVQHEVNIQKGEGPDLISLGKALSGGMLPVSCVLAKTNEIMNVLTPGTHGSTYGGNSLACRVAITSLQVIRDEQLCQRSEELGKLFLKGLKEIQNEFDIVLATRGRGLFCAMEIADVQTAKHKINAWEVCLKLKEKGLLAKSTHEHIIRFAPPLVITKQQIEQALEIIRQSLKALKI